MAFADSRWLLPALVVASAACNDPVRPTPAEPGMDVIIDSDPSGADVVLDGLATGQTTPATLSGLTATSHSAILSADSNGVRYEVSVSFVPSTDSVTSFTAPLGFRCLGSPCGGTEHTAGDLRFFTRPNGSLLYAGGNQELFWPASSTQNFYVAAGMPMFVGVDSRGDTAAIGQYDGIMLYGRPAREIEEAPFALRQSAWFLPPAAVASMNVSRGIRGIQVDEEVIGGPEAPDGLLLRLTFTNVTDQPAYVLADPLATGSISYSDVWIGFALDADVGVSEDDLVGYDADPSRRMAYIYDSDFSEASFSADWSARPGLIGIRVAEAPAGTSVRMNAWPRVLDWKANALRALEVGGLGFAAEPTGFAWVTASGTRDTHPDAAIGIQPTAIDDYRIVVAAGPLSLAPGESASVAVLLAIAEPTPGTFVSGTVVAPGDPADTGRPLFAIAADLRDAFVAAEALLTR
jgi:hypothetical protein